MWRIINLDCGRTVDRFNCKRTMQAKFVSM